MNLNDFANLAQIIGAAAVVISLIYVAVQIRQNTNAFRATTAQSIHEHFAGWYHLIEADRSLAQVVVEGLKDYRSLAEKDKARFVATFMTFLSYSQNAFLKWREGLLAPSLWMGRELLIMNFPVRPEGELAGTRVPFRRRFPAAPQGRFDETNSSSSGQTAGRIQYRSIRVGSHY